MEVRRQLRKLYGDRRKQIQLIKHVLVADYAKPVNFGVFNCCIPKWFNQIDTAHLLKSNTSTPKVYYEPPSVSEILYQLIVGAWWEFMVVIDYLMIIPGCDWLLINQSIAGTLVEQLACRTHWNQYKITKSSKR